MKKEYIKPMMEGEIFSPNEYIAVCYSVVCDTRAANAFEQTCIIGYTGKGSHKIPIYNYNAGQTHSPDACGALGNYYATDDNGDGLIDSLTEYSADQGALPCTLYTDASYNTVANWNTVSVNSGTIYWTTTSEDGSRTWHHQGPVNIADASHPNRS